MDLSRYEPGIKVGQPHTSEWGGGREHRDVGFERGRLPGQLPIPFPKIHEPTQQPRLVPDPPSR